MLGKFHLRICSKSGRCWAITTVYIDDAQTIVKGVWVVAVVVWRVSSDLSNGVCRVVAVVEIVEQRWWQSVLANDGGSGD